MKLLIDMNLSPLWVGFLASRGVEAVHWSTVGDPRAKDSTIMEWEWARAGGYVVFTHDLDFSTLHTDALEQGAIVTIDELASRVRILPIRSARGR